MTNLKIASVCIAATIGASACAMPQQRGNMFDWGTPNQAQAADRYCVKKSGSLLLVENDRGDNTGSFNDVCVNAGGRVYTREDIRSTGETDLAEALRKLDPSIR
ncbi:MAG: hypothetical protein M3Q42_06830 [Pseudomonadota bacterium]|nr:hypothetical protein [Pseudomonadota bacterium]